MNRNQRSGVLAATLYASALAFVIDVQAGTVDQDLTDAVAERDPGEYVAVIIRLENRVDLSDYRDKDVKKRAKKLVKSLKAFADKQDVKDLKKQLKTLDAKDVVDLWVISGIALRVRADKVQDLAALAAVERVSLDAEVALPAGTVSGAWPPEWNIDLVAAPPMWDQGFDGSGVVVALLDSGVDPDHPDIGADYRGGGNSWFDPHGEHPAGPYDADGHGTWATGLILGGDAGGSVIGVAPGAKWIAAKIFSDAGTAQLSDIHQGFQWALDPDNNPSTTDFPDIVNNSWYLDGSINQCDSEFAVDIATLKTAEIAVVFAAGNTGPNPSTSTSPANNSGTLAVGSMGSTEWGGVWYHYVANDSARGASACDGGIFPHVAAPGVDVRTSDLTLGGVFPDSYVTVSGTSFAAPHVAGAMALLKGAFPEATVSQLESALSQSATDLPPSGPDNDSGAGLIDIVGAHEWLEDNIGQPQPGELQLSAEDYGADEDAGSITVTVSRTGGSAGDVEVDYATSDGSATAGADYASTTGTLTLLDGETSQTFSVALLDDSDYEGDENFTLTLSNPTGGASLGSPVNGTVTILDDDPLPNNPPAITSSPVTTATEGESYGYDVDATDPDAGDVLTFSLDVSPTGMSIDSGSGLIAWTPGAQQVGSNDVTVRVTDDRGLFDTQSFSIDVSGGGSSGVLLYFSTETNVAVPGVSGPYDDADIYSWDGSSFARVLDASAAGLPGNADVDALALDGDVYYLSFRRNGGTSVPGLGSVDDEDIVRYESGTWSLFFDGGAAGLGDANAEDLDAFAILENGDLLVSSVGNNRVPGVGRANRDEDLLRCQPNAVPVTACTWSVYFDGSDVGLNNSADEDVDGVALAGAAAIQLSTVGAFNVSGLSGDDEDVFVCESPTTGAATACASFSLLFDGGASGLADDVDAIDRP